MNARKVNTVFKKIKEATGMTYAITNTDDYGDCQSCVNYSLYSEFGGESTGIFLKHWRRGMNASGAIKNENRLLIAHDITEKQAKEMVKILESNGYVVTPREYNPAKCFIICEV